MVGPIESVTVAVSDLERHRQLLQERFGLTTVSDGHASVGLLSAWRYPVHESVRLMELAHDAQPHGRVRLSLFEDAQPGTSAAQTPTDEPFPNAGPRALDFRADVTDWETRCIQSIDFPLLITNKTQRRGALSLIWVLSADIELAERFYIEALGYRLEQATDMSVGKDSPCFEDLGFGRGTNLHLARLRSGTATSGGVLLIGSPERRWSAGTSPLGARGVNLLTCRCDDLDDLIGLLSPFEIQPVAAPSHVGLPDGRPARVMVARGPSNETFEFIEIED